MFLQWHSLTTAVPCKRWLRLIEPHPVIHGVCNYHLSLKHDSSITGGQGIAWQRIASKMWQTGTPSCIKPQVQYQREDGVAYHMLELTELLYLLGSCSFPGLFEVVPFLVPQDMNWIFCINHAVHLETCSCEFHTISSFPYPTFSLFPHYLRA